MVYQLRKQEHKQFIVKMYSTGSGEQMYKFDRTAEEMKTMNWEYYLQLNNGLECQVFSNPSWGMPQEFYELTAADEMAIRYMLAIISTVTASGYQKSVNQSCNKVAAIKYFRERFGVGLKEAKDAVELYEKELLETPKY